MIAGCGSTQTTTTTKAADHPPSAFERPVAPDATAITGGSPAERSELRDVLRVLGGTGIGALDISPAGTEWTPHPDDAVILSYTAGTDDEADWEGNLVGGAFAARSRASGLPRVIAIQGSSGGSRLGDEAPPASDSSSAADIRAAVEEATSRQGAEVTGLKVLELDGRPVVRLSIQVDDPARFLLEGLSVVLAAIPQTAAGRYLQVVDGSGQLALRSGGVSYGESMGMGWNRPDLDSCTPFIHSEPAGYQAAPCPVDGPHVSALPGTSPTKSAAEVESIVAGEARRGETVMGLEVGPAASLCTAWRMASCPSTAPTVWLAELRQDPDTSSGRWVMVDDADGQVVGRGELPH